jgi:NADP-dependent 3-hydroxy acid dehydrogenase YdfG
MTTLMTDEVAIVAGPSRLVTESVVRELLLKNATVIVPAKSAREIALLKESLVGIDSGKLVTLLTDYPDYDKASEIAENIVEQFGKIDLAVISFDRPQSTGLLTESDTIEWNKMIDQNITPFFIVSRVVLENMKANKKGVIISIINALDTGEEKPSALANLCTMMQTEMAKLISEEVKKYDIKCYHLLATHFTDPLLHYSINTLHNDAELNSIGHYIFQLFNRETKDTERLFENLVLNVTSSNVTLNPIQTYS